MDEPSPPEATSPEEAREGEPLLEDEVVLPEPEKASVAPEEMDLAAEREETEPREELELAREEILSLTEELEAVRREKDEYLDNARRMKAELENSRKRLERERTRMAELASERLVRELLPVLDNLERALEVEGDIREGVRATRDQLVAVLAAEGLTPVASDGESFDPNFHEAIMGQPSDEHEEDTVIQTLERGYILNGRPLRPAKVIVSKQV